jgi:uncharacterized membrane protein
MSEQNPFVVGPSGSPGSTGQTTEGRSVEAGRSIEWLKGGWELFLKNPGTWIGLGLVVMVVFAVLNFVPLIGHLALVFLMPIVSAGLLLGCKSLRDGGELRFDHLVAGFKQSTSNLIMIGVLSLTGFIVIGVVIGVLALVIGGGALLSAGLMGNVTGIGAAIGGVLLAMLVMLALTVPLSMALWYAPALVVFRDIAAVEAMKLSFNVCLKNVFPFLVYGVIAMVLAIVASLPLGLGWLVLFPVLIGTHYTSYVDLFE